ncbi:MAG: AMP-binding protein [Pseudomonadales bacterium]
MKSIPLIRNFEGARVIATDGTDTWTQEELLGTANALTEMLGEGKHVINLCQNRYHFLLGFVAGILSGKITLLPPTSQELSITGLLGQYPGTTVLTDTDTDFEGFKCVDLRKLNLDCRPVTVPNIDTDQPVAIAFTSGTTGTPMPHPKPWGFLAVTGQLLGERFGIAENSAVVGTVPSQHMYGLEMTILMALQCGATIYARLPFYPRDIHRCVSKLDKCVLVSTPVHLRAAMGSKLRSRPAKVISATAPLPEAVTKNIEQELGCPVEELYGCTESGSVATRRPINQSSWQLLPTMTLSQHGETTFVSAPHLMGDIELPDRIKIDEHGFELLGRNADMLNVAGKRFSLNELTSLMMHIEGVDDAVAFLPEPRDDVERPAAVVVGTATSRYIAQQLASKVDAAFIPRPIVHVSEIPRNKTGKVVRANLIQVFKAARS